MGDETDGTHRYTRRQGTDEARSRDTNALRTPKPKKSGLMVESVRALVVPEERSSKRKPLFSFDPPTLEFQGAIEREARIYNNSDQSQTIDDWELVGDVTSFATRFLGARSVPLAPKASLGFRVVFQSEAAVPQAAALIVRTGTDTSRLDLIGMMPTIVGDKSAEVDENSGVSIEATHRTDGRMRCLAHSSASVRPSRPWRRTRRLPYPI